MTTVISKSELSRPYALNADNVASALFDTVHLFADSGDVTDRPAVFTDLLGKHDLSMTYGAVGGMVGDDLQLADNGNGQLNTYGEFQGIDSTWSNGLIDRSRLYLIDTVYRANSRTWQYLISGAGLRVRLIRDTGALEISLENINSHRVVSNYVPADGERLVIAAQIDQTLNQAIVVVNGQSMVAMPNGFPFGSSNSRPIQHPWFGRHFPWPNFYGWDGTVSLFCMGYHFNGSELSEEQLINLTLNPYDVFQTNSTALPIEQEITAPSAIQGVLAKSAAIEQAQVMTTPISRQVIQANPASLGGDSSLYAPGALQHVVAALSVIDSHQQLLSEKSTQHIIASTVTVNQDYHLVAHKAISKVKAVVLSIEQQHYLLASSAKQLVKASALTVDSNITLYAVPAQQLVTARTLEVEQGAQQVIAVVRAYQRTVAHVVNVSTQADINTVKSVQQVKAEALNVEQLLEQRITIEAATQGVFAQPGLVDIQQMLTTDKALQEVRAKAAFLLVEGEEVDLTGLELTRITETYTLERITPIFNLERIN
ncbi:hypothetical protein EYS14_03280 [Alteromonadaceae bacterium M269]|nr:hypothetical protein EYS14_03280 [Alteromonadaceae bacterium M269]